MRHGGYTVAVVIMLALLAPAVGCGSEEEEAPIAPGPSINTRGPRSSLLATTPTEGATPSAPSAPFVPHPLTLQAAKQAAPAVIVEAKPEEKEKPRDYSNELVRAVGGTEGCVKQRPANAALPEKTSVSLEAYVLESGAVSRGYARSSDLAADELECVKQRIESARFAPDVKEAPRRVDATVQLTFKRPEPSGAAAAAGTKAAPPAMPGTTPAPAPAPAADGTTNGPQNTPSPRY